MTALAEKKCVPCEGGTPALSESEARTLLGQVDGWKLVQPEGGAARIEKRFKFDGFMPGVDFVNQVARVAEDEGHHPDILLKWGEVRVTVWTHAANGLTENDFILAAKIDRLPQRA
jgi:4a-hydroxytetrahydrobiopterin dehydratase